MVFPPYLTPDNDCFLLITSRLTAGEQICSIDLNYFSEVRGFSAGDTFHQIAATHVTVVVTDYCSEKKNSLLGDGNDNVAGYNNRTSGVKPGFRLFCVPVIVSQTEARGS